MFDLPANLRMRYVCILNNVPCRFVACAMSGSSVCVMCSFLSHALRSAARRSLVLDFSASAKAMWAVMTSRGLEFVTQYKLSLFWKMEMSAGLLIVICPSFLCEYDSSLP